MKHRDTFLGYAVALWALSVIFLAGPNIYGPTKMEVRNLMGNAVGVSAAIPPNEFNSLASQLSDKEREINLRAQALSAREQSILSELDSIQMERETRVYQYLFGLTALLLVLVGMNYYLDYHRREYTVAA